MVTIYFFVCLHTAYTVQNDCNLSSSTVWTDHYVITAYIDILWEGWWCSGSNSFEHSFSVLKKAVRKDKRKLSKWSVHSSNSKYFSVVVFLWNWILSAHRLCCKENEDILSDIAGARAQHCSIYGNVSEHRCFTVQKRAWKVLPQYPKMRPSIQWSVMIFSLGLSCGARL